MPKESGPYTELYKDAIIWVYATAKKWEWQIVYRDLSVKSEVKDIRVSSEKSCTSKEEAIKKARNYIDSKVRK